MSAQFSLSLTGSRDFELSCNSYYIVHRSQFVVQSAYYNTDQWFTRINSAAGTGRDFLPKSGGTTSPPLLYSPLLFPSVTSPFRSRAINRARGSREVL